MIRPDYHTHTHFSPDSAALHLDMARAAAQRGVTHLCFTDHMDLYHPDPQFDCCPDFEGMLAAVEEINGAVPGLFIRLGLEAGYLPEAVEDTSRYIAAHPLDYVINSAHVAGKYDCWVPEYSAGTDRQSGFTRYLEAVLRSVEDARTDYDCVGHIGYVAKCLHYDNNTLDYAFAPELIDRILTHIVSRGKGIEINTSGIARNGHALPHVSIVRRFRELGGEIVTIGSDAHAPDRVGDRITEGLAIAKEAGFSHVAVFTQRKPEFFPITL